MVVGSVLEEQIYKSGLASGLAWVLCKQLHAHTSPLWEMENGDLAVPALLLQQHM